MTFCTQCGTDNDDSRKYCRECGKRLQTAEPSSTAEAPTPSGTADAQETAVGEMLYECFRLYENQKFEAATAKSREALALNPRSTSAYTLLSMIYEKQGEIEESEGDTQAARGYYLQAARERKRVLQLSPGSVVDSEKLKELRKKLGDDSERSAGPAAAVGWLERATRRIPVPLLASVAVAVVVFALATAVMNGGKGRRQAKMPQPARTAQTQPAPGQQQQYPYGYGGQQQATSAPSDETPSSGSDTLTFAAPEPTQAPKPPTRKPSPSPVTSSPAEPVPKIPVPTPKLPEPLDVPSDIKIVPFQGNKQPAPTAKPNDSQAANKPAQPTTPSNQAEIVISPAEKTGADYQREAMRQMTEGKKDEAAQNFRRAIDAYNNQISKGIDPQAASAGIRTCRIYLQSLQQ